MPAASTQVMRTLERPVAGEWLLGSVHQCRCSEADRSLDVTGPHLQRRLPPSTIMVGATPPHRPPLMRQIVLASELPATASQGRH